MNHHLLTYLLPVVVVMLNTFPGNAQVNPVSSRDSLGKVMNIPERISGNFGEIRSNHFHSGIDYKTNEQIGYEVFAASDGFISRVRVAAGGFGKAVYIDHPGGITTVYAHLRAFYPVLEDSITKLQYNKKEFEVEIFPSRDVFPVKRGQLIGYAGNSGSSEGPHLHFETRDTKSEKPFNPETVGYPITDTIPPTISSVVLYHPGPSNGLFGSTKQIYPVKPGWRFINTITDTLYTSSEFFLGIECFDKAGTEENILGVRSYQLFLNDTLAFSYRIEEFAFHESRFVNALIDYPFKRETGRTILLCKKLDGNKLDFVVPSKLKIVINTNETLQGKIRVEDQNKNFSEVHFVLKNVGLNNSPKSKPSGTKITYGEPLAISEKEYKIRFKQNSVYEDCLINHSYAPSKSSDHWSGILEIQPANLAIHEAIDISIKPQKMPAGQEQKLVMVGIDAKGKEESMGGEFSGGWMNATSRMLGKFVLKIDTITPVAASPKWITDGLTKMQMVVIPVNDNLVGIKTYKVLLNDNWVLGEYNSRYKEITVYPNHLPTMITIFNITVELEDRVGNKSVYQFTLNR